MQQQELNQFLYYLKHTLECQQQSILQLEQEIGSLKSALEELKQKPAMHVERMEYKFDQLKVEKLDGTLNIGLTPSDLDNIDALEVHQKGELPPYLIPQREEVVKQLMENAIIYLDQNKSEIFNEAERSSEQKADDAMRSFILDDLLRQLPQRIGYYLDQTPLSQRNEQQLGEVYEQISEAIQTDIRNAIIRFLKNYPESLKEERI